MSEMDMRVDATTDAATDARVAGYGYLAVPVSDLARAKEFYCRLLGFSELGSDMLPQLNSHAVVATRSGKMVALTLVAERLDMRETGVHQAYRVGSDARAAIADRLAAAGVEIFRYVEDRPAEADDNVYLFDPDGNRLQLVADGQAGSYAGITDIDHAAVLAPDMLWAEDFYANTLGFSVEGRIGWCTEDHARARRWAAGEEAMAPGTRRLDKRYTTIGTAREVARSNMQIFFRAGDGILAVYLATQHYQEPPEEQLVGAPRTAFFTSRTKLDHLASVLEARGYAFEGPVEHPSSAPLSASLYFKDLGGNFLEFCTPRGEAGGT